MSTSSETGFKPDILEEESAALRDLRRPEVVGDLKNPEVLDTLRELERSSTIEHFDRTARRLLRQLMPERTPLLNWVDTLRSEVFREELSMLNREISAEKRTPQSRAIREKEKGIIESIYARHLHTTKEER